jgi:hypothetical protein
MNAALRFIVPPSVSFTDPANHSNNGVKRFPPNDFNIPQGIEIGFWGKYFSREYNPRKPSLSSAKSVLPSLLQKMESWKSGELRRAVYLRKLPERGCPNSPFTPESFFTVKEHPIPLQYN